MANEKNLGESGLGQRFLIACTDGSMRKVHTEERPAAGTPLTAAERAAVMPLIESAIRGLTSLLAEGDAFRADEAQWVTIPADLQEQHAARMGALSARRALLESAQAKLGGPEVEGVIYVANPGETL